MVPDVCLACEMRIAHDTWHVIGAWPIVCAWPVNVRDVCMTCEV